MNIPTQEEINSWLDDAEGLLKYKWYYSKASVLNAHKISRLAHYVKYLEKKTKYLESKVKYEDVVR